MVIYLLKTLLKRGSVLAGPSPTTVTASVSEPGLAGGGGAVGGERQKEARETEISQAYQVTNESAAFGHVTQCSSLIG